jgi:hypothetical protein
MRLSKKVTKQGEVLKERRMGGAIISCLLLLLVIS